MVRFDLFKSFRQRRVRQKPHRITRQQVIEAYQTILGRAPESDEVVDAHVRQHGSEHRLWYVMLNGDEFTELRRAYLDAQQEPLVETPLPVARLSREQVIEGYRAVLGRTPESEDVIDDYLAHHADEHSLWRALVASPEFVSLRPHEYSDDAIMRVIHETFHRPAGFIDHEVSDETLAAMLARIQAQWTRLGTETPHWSVLTEDRFKADVINDQVIEDFYATGAGSAALIRHFEQRAGVEPTRGVCLELGCGVGRVTEHLSTIFEEVIAVDISPANLALCRERMQRRGITNVHLVQLGKFDDLRSLPQVDFLYSFIVLQHNPPPVQRALLDALLGKIRAGGQVLFQIPTDLEGYRFSADQYLGTEDVGMEIHALPRAEVLRLMADHGLTVFDVVPDTFVGAYGSDTFFGGKVHDVSCARL